MPRVIVCDVNETLLDVGALEPDFTEVFGDAHVLQDWFSTAPRRCACVGHRRSAPRRMCRGIRCETREGAVPPRSAAVGPDFRNVAQAIVAAERG